MKSKRLNRPFSLLCNCLRSVLVESHYADADADERRGLCLLFVESAEEGVVEPAGGKTTDT